MSLGALHRRQADGLVHVGRDGWLFLVGGTNSVIDLYAEVSSFDAGMAEQWVSLLQSRHDTFEARGIEYLHLGAPEKLSVLAQHYDGELPDPDGGPIMQLATGHGARIPCFLNVVPYLRRHSDTYPIYWKTDTHWSAWGSFLAYQQICARLGLPACTDILSYPHHEGEIAMDLGAKMDPAVTENIRFYRLEKHSRRVYANPLVRYKEQGGYRNDAALHVGSNVIYRNDSATADPRTVVLFGDSFSEYRNHLLTGMLAETVRELHFIWSSNIDHEYVRRVRPDIVITELAERFMTTVPADDVDIDSIGHERIRKHRAGSVTSLENRRSFIKRTPLLESETRTLAEPALIQTGCDLTDRDRQTISEPVELVEAHNVSIYFNGLRCLARAPGGEAVVSYGVDADRASRVATEEYRVLGGFSLLLGDSPHAGRYDHWMLDILPKLGLLQRAGKNTAQISQFLVRQLGSDFQRETLAQLNVPMERVVQTLHDQYLQCERLLHVPLVHGANLSMQRWVPEWLQQTFNVASPQATTRLYLRRPADARGGIANEEELLPILEAHGIDCRTLDGLSVAEQARLCSQAALLIAPHGTALTNMVFAGRGVQVLELFGRDVDTRAYGLAHTCGHRYMALLARPDLDLHKLVCRDPSLEPGGMPASTITPVSTLPESFCVAPDLLDRALSTLGAA